MAENNVVGMGNEAEKAGGAIDYLNQLMGKAVEMMGGLGGKAMEAGQSVLGLGDRITGVGNVLKGIAPMSDQASRAIGLFGAAVLSTSEILKAFKPPTATFQSITDQVMGSIEPMAKAAGGMRVLAESLGLKIKKNDSLDDITEAVKKQIAHMGEGVDAAQNFQNAYMKMMLSSGQGATLFNTAGRSLENLNAILKDQGLALAHLSGTTAIAYPELVKFYTAMGQIPGALNPVKGATTDTAGSMEKMRTAIMIAQGAGMDLGVAITQLKNAYDIFGKTGDRANEFLARQTELADNLGIPVDKTTQYLNDMAEKLKYVGDNSRGASMDLQRMFHNLQDSGLGVQPALELMGKMQTAMANLSVGQEAFISARSGGRGGLVGAFDIERELKEGKLDDVMKKQRAAFINTAGGHLATLEGTKTAEGAREWQKQRSMLMGGAFGGMNLDKNQASRLMEAMGKPEGAARTKDMNEAIQTSAQKGEEVAKQNLTVLTHADANLEAIKMNDMELLAAFKSHFGVSNTDPKFSSRDGLSKNALRSNGRTGTRSFTKRVRYWTNRL